MLIKPQLKSEKPRLAWISITRKELEIAFSYNDKIATENFNDGSFYTYYRELTECVCYSPTIFCIAISEGYILFNGDTTYSAYPHCFQL